jgi:hypothetical protein
MACCKLLVYRCKICYYKEGKVGKAKNSDFRTANLQKLNAMKNIMKSLFIFYGKQFHGTNCL